jgi:CHAT domain-containing protein
VTKTAFCRRERFWLRLNADLVTLSACETGSGKVQGQEGVSNLVRPFLASGARAVVANLWSADDMFSLALMKEFYRALAAGQDKAAALQTAKRKIVREFGPQATQSSGPALNCPAKVGVRLWFGVVRGTECLFLKKVIDGPFLRRWFKLQSESLPTRG